MNLSKDVFQAQQVEERKLFLRNALRRMNTNQTIDGRSIDDVSLYTLEHTYISVTTEIAKEWRRNNESR
ncbi:hypothetical protein [Halobacillus sp. A5]|uniref:hypothetical protein n=1 Tax=Halobacillus sp. A5 TaxID=2880263 RepID=UPI0020A6430B|nr:hypothetical protein [Halobacillus sp. A5]MCP3026634.1 hypothetical protein [Halobacillus sp. A5]